MNNEWHMVDIFILTWLNIIMVVLLLLYFIRLAPGQLFIGSRSTWGISDNPDFKLRKGKNYYAGITAIILDQILAPG